MRNLIIAILLIGISACNSNENMDKTIYFVRHAEKDTSIEKDPPLSTDGVMRSVDLASWFKDKQVDTVFSSDTKRNIETASPLLDEKNLELGKYDPQDFEGFAKKLKEADAKNIVVIGHSNTILEQIEALGAERPQETIDEATEYDKIFELDMDTKEVKVHQYGSKSN